MSKQVKNKKVFKNGAIGGYVKQNDGSWKWRIINNIKKKQHGGNADLFKAVMEDNNEKVLSILSTNNSVDVNYIAPNGKNALYEAVLRDNFNISQLLVEAKTNVNYIYPNGKTALYEAVIFGYKIDIVKLLINANADVNTVYENGKTVLDIAFRNYPIYPDIIFTLINAGAIIKPIHNNYIGEVLSKLSNENISKLSNVTLKNKISKFRQNALNKEEKMRQKEEKMRQNALNKAEKIRQNILNLENTESEYCTSIKCKALEKWINENQELINGKNITIQDGQFPNIYYPNKLKEWFNFTKGAVKNDSPMQYSLMMPGGKLEGILWYAKGDKWLFHKLVKYDFEEKIAENIYEFKINEAKIYNISNVENVVKNGKTHKNRLKWPSLVMNKNYCGLYADLSKLDKSGNFGNYSQNKIFKFFEVDSGAIWNTECVISHKLLATYNDKKKKFENV